jgi:mono/diheme cytochrome c family protein
MTRLSIALVALAWIGVAAGPAAAGGKEDYAKHCVSCHGPDGKGKTKMGEKLSIKDLTDAKVQKAFTDEQAVKDITEGLKDPETGKVLMPPKKGKLTPEQIKEVVAYVRTLSGK